MMPFLLKFSTVFVCLLCLLGIGWVLVYIEQLIANRYGFIAEALFILTVISVVFAAYIK
jgi:hypothetical protein